MIIRITLAPDSCKISIIFFVAILARAPTKAIGADVPKGVFGLQRLAGVLVVDRYAGYNKVP